MLSQSSFCNQYLLNLSCLVDWIFLMKDFCLFIQVCSSVWSSEGLISISGILEFLAAKAANSPPHVLHQEPGPLRRWNAHTTREAHPAGLELLWILHGPGTWKEAPECRPVCYPVLELCPRRLQEPSVDFQFCLMCVSCRRSWPLFLKCCSSLRTPWSSMMSWMLFLPSMSLTLEREVRNHLIIMLCFSLSLLIKRNTVCIFVSIIKGTR